MLAPCLLSKQLINIARGILCIPPQCSFPLSLFCNYIARGIKVHIMLSMPGLTLLHSWVPVVHQQTDINGVAPGVVRPGGTSPGANPPANLGLKPPHTTAHYSMALLRLLRYTGWWLGRHATVAWTL